MSGYYVTAIDSGRVALLVGPLQSHEAALARVTAAKRSAKDNATFIQISPHPILTDAITETLGDGHHHSVGTLRRDGDDTLSFHTNLNATHGIYPPETPHSAEPHPVLPTLPRQRTRLSISIARARRRVEAVQSRADAGRGTEPWT
jgi:phthiocerol/phenolphthiocerol synthesis type-I polyketide synthase B